MQVTTVLGIVEDFTGLCEHCRRHFLLRALYRPVLCEKVAFAPIFPGLERLTVDLRREANAVSLIEVKADDLDARPARKVRSVLPQRAVGRGVVGADS